MASRKQREAAKKAAKSAAVPSGETVGGDGAADGVTAKPTERAFSAAAELRDSESDGESFDLDSLRKQIVDSEGTGASLREKALNDLLHSKLTLIPAADGVTWSMDRN